MFQNSGKLGSFYTTNWKEKSPYQTETSQDRGSGISQKDYGEVLIDENGIPYRDIRIRRSSAMSENPVDISFQREYDTDNRMYKKAIKKELHNPSFYHGFYTGKNYMTGEPTINGYTQEQVDSLTTHFDKLYGTPVVK